MGLLPKQRSRNPREGAQERENVLVPTPLEMLRARAPGTHPPLTITRTAKREVCILFLWHPGIFTKSKAGLRASDSGWVVWEIPAELSASSDQKLRLSTTSQACGLLCPSVTPSYVENQVPSSTPPIWQESFLSSGCNVSWPPESKGQSEKLPSAQGSRNLAC